MTTTTTGTVTCTDPAGCDAPATTTRPTSVSRYFAPLDTDTRVALCEKHAVQLDRDVRDVHADRANEW